MTRGSGNGEIGSTSATADIFRAIGLDGERWPHGICPQCHGTLTHKFYDQKLGKWTDWLQFEGGEVSSASSAVMAGTRLAVFARNVHGSLTHRFYDPQRQSWTPWIDLGAEQISSTPCAVMAGDRLTVFARAMDGTLTHKFYDPLKQAWTGWIHLGDGLIASSPSAVIAGSRLAVFARSSQGTLTHKYSDMTSTGTEGQWADDSCHRWTNLLCAIRRIGRHTTNGVCPHGGGHAYPYVL